MYRLDLIKPHSARVLFRVMFINISKYFTGLSYSAGKLVKIKVIILQN